MVQLNNNGSDKNNSNIAFILIPVLFILVILGGLGLGIYLIITSFTSLENKNTDANEIATQSVTVVPDSNTKESSLEKTSLKSEITKDFNDTDKTNDKKEVKEIIQPSKIETNEVVANETEANEVVANETETKEVVTNETEFNDNALVQENVDNNFSEPNEELKDSKIEPSIEEKNSSPKIVEEEVLVQSEEQLATAKDNEQLKPTITIDTNIETDVRFDVGAIARARNVEEYKQQRSVSQKFEEKRKIMEERRKKIEEQRNKFEEKRRQYQSKNHRLFTYKELNQMVDLLKSVSANKKYNDDIIILDVRKDAGISYVYTYLVQGRTLNEFLRYERKQREALITKKTCERIKQDLGVSQKLKRLSYMAHEFIDPHQRTIAYVVVSKKSCNLD